MAKIRNDYENSWWPRLLRWLDGGTEQLDNSMASDLIDSSAAHHVETTEEAAAREDAIEARRIKALEEERETYDRLHRWSKTKGSKIVNRLYGLMAVVICVTIIVVLLNTTAQLPSFGNPDNPVNNEVSERYIEKGMQETGAVNIVAGMILDYRAFDTLMPSTPEIASFTLLPMLYILFKSEPNILIAIFARVPESIASIR